MESAVMSELAPFPVTTPAGPAPTRDPVLAALERIERRLGEVERVTRALAPLVDAAPGGTAMLVDTFDAVAAKLGESGTDIDARLRSVVRAVEVSTAPRAVHGLAALIESKLLEPSALAVVSRLAAALAEPGDTKPVGTFGLLRALRDPEIQRALGFLLAVAREFGRHLGNGELEECRQRLLSAAEEP